MPTALRRTSAQPLRRLRVFCGLCGECRVLRAVANDPARLDVERHVAEGQPRLVAQARDEGEESFDVACVGHESERRPDRAGALPAAVLYTPYRSILYSGSE